MSSKFKVGQLVIFDNFSDDDTPGEYADDGYILGNHYKILSISSGQYDLYPVLLEPSDPTKFNALRFKFNMLRPTTVIRRP